MTISDDDHIAPVINLFGNRAEVGAATSAMESSSESLDDLDIAPHLSTDEQGWATEAPVESLPHDTRDLDSDSDSLSAVPLSETQRVPGASISPIRALPTMSDFESESSRTRTESDGTAGTPAGETADAQSAHSSVHRDGSSRSARREARDGFSEISRVSMRALARRGMSTHEMTQFLATREFEAEEIAAEIARLERSALLDDAALAETLTRTLRERKGLGAAAITAELRRRKIDQEHIGAAVDFEHDEEQERANELALKRAPQLRSLDSVTAKRRLRGFLMRKGYSGSVVSAAVATALESGGGSSNGPTFR